MDHVSCADHAMYRWSLILASCVSLLLACQAPAATGAACTRPSECSAPLTCLHGRCRSECREARDCPVGLRCLIDASGNGVCSIPPEDRCAGDPECGTDLVCAGGECRTTCSAGASCGVGGTCSAGSCVVPRSGTDAGVASDGGGLGDGGRPLVGTGAPCSGGSCPTGYDCTTATETTSMPVCRRSCTSDPDCMNEGLGSFCQTNGYCTTPCDPAADLGCGEETCGYFGGNPPEGTRDYTDCRPIGPAAEGASCMSDLECGAAMNCTTGACRRTCHPTLPSPAECTGGLDCFGASTIVNGTAAAYGSCCHAVTGC